MPDANRSQASRMSRRLRGITSEKRTGPAVGDDRVGGRWLEADEIDLERAIAGHVAAQDRGAVDAEVGGPCPPDGVGLHWREDHRGQEARDPEDENHLAGTGEGAAARLLHPRTLPEAGT